MASIASVDWAASSISDTISTDFYGLMSSRLQSPLQLAELRQLDLNSVTIQPMP